MDNYKNHFKKLKQKKGEKVKAHRVSLNYKSNRVRSNSTRSYAWGAFCLFCFGLTLTGLLYPDKINEIASRIEIGFLPASLASEAAKEGEKSSHDSGSKEEKKSPAPTAAAPAKAGETAAAVPEKPSYVQGLMDKEKELDEREKKLVELDEKLQQEKLELDKKIQALEQTRRDIASKLETRVAQDEENLTKLVGVYSNMKPQSAALIVAKMEDDLAISILKRMKKQDAANILNNIETERAKTLSEKFSGY